MSFGDKIVSICLPTYNKKGTRHGFLYNNITMLRNLFASIEKQTFKDFELIVSDHSKDESVKRICDKWEKQLNIKYFKFEEKYGSCEANLNNAMSKASGKYIKPMFQDDYFYVPTALEKMVMALEASSKYWVAVGCSHINENNYRKVFRPHAPSYTDGSSLFTGDNSIGSPIVIMHRNSQEYYDESLIWLSDVEFYYRIFKKYGLPIFLNESLLISRLRKDGITNTSITEEIVQREIKYCVNKHRVQLPLATGAYEG